MATGLSTHSGALIASIDKAKKAYQPMLFDLGRQVYE